jgi:predicted enzyme related to lactoylglutathione lyase
MSNSISWFEIPVTDFDRAKRFYEAVLGINIETLNMGPDTMGMFSTDPNVVSGAIVYNTDATPSKQGVTIYLNGGDDLAPLLARVVPAGGTVLVPKTEIGSDFGFFAHFVDTEGNKIGLHAMA